MQSEPQIPIELVECLRRELRTLTPRSERGLLRAPGRINVIGEHTDYSGGLALPAAVDRGLTIAFGLSPDGRTRLLSLEEPRPVELDGSGRLNDASGSWGRYVAAVLEVFGERHGPCPPFVAALGSTIPRGGGLSSSAALCVALTRVAAELAGVPLSTLDCCFLAQAAEHRVGVRCGLLDQYAIVHGRAGHALLLDCTTLEHRPVPLDLLGYVLVVGDTGKPRGLVDSEYNLRRHQLEQAAGLLRPDGALRDVSVDELDARRGDLGPLLWRRAHHVVTENSRVLAVAALLEDASCTEDAPATSRLPQRLGELLDGSHRSLRDDFEVSCPELDALVDALRAQGDERVPGARMMGGGFGGCVLALAAEEGLEHTLARAAEAYHRASGREPTFFPVRPAAGAHLIDTGARR